ncbi:MAG: DUF2693 domain-containing protein [Paludibacteraceae bacterium]|nr:DUF2693 domain-containing protein [Paludibacteraceae bacterium]
MNTNTNSRVMHMAHALHKTHPHDEWSEILKLAWQFICLRQMLQRGIVKFSYYKINDVILTRVVRPARGTLNPELIPADKLPKDSPLYTPNYSTMAYYDIDTQGWRSFKLDCLHNIESYATLNTIDLSAEDAE